MTSFVEIQKFCKKYSLNLIERNVKDLSIADNVLELISSTDAMHYMVLPWRLDNIDGTNSLKIFTCNLQIFRIEQEILNKTKGAANKLDITFLPEEYLLEGIRFFYNLEQDVSSFGSSAAVNLDIVDEEEESSEENVQDLSQDLLDGSNSPTVTLVTSIITTAIQKKASDIHLEPEHVGMLVKYRIDGTLIPQASFRISERNKAKVIARIKIMAKLDVSKKLDPQDGQIMLKYNNNNIDFRVNFIPTMNGEKCVLRILDKSNSMLDLDSLGFKDEDTRIFQKIISKPTGVVLITGPTGSGKSTTLYSFLSRLDHVAKNITTVEDPVEYQLEGINQIQVKEKHVDFADALRAILRQDPDIIMIGEIRDHETAENMVQAAQTGHLVFSTLHTNDAISAINRLIRLGVSVDSIAQTLSMTMAQRLVRRICQNCIEEYAPDFNALGLSDKNIRYLNKGNTRFYRGRGCSNCDFTGYKGRTTAYEYFVMTDEVREMIENGTSVYEIKRKLQENGFISMWHMALDLVKQGKTTIEEVRRAVLESNEDF